MAGRSERNLIREVDIRPLIASSGIWLAEHGVVNKTDAPNVILKWCLLLEKEGVTSNILSSGNRASPLPLADRVQRWLQDYICRPPDANPEGGAGVRGFRLQVHADADLNTPMRDLDRFGRVRRMDPGVEPTAGHSGNSIIGGGLTKQTSPVLPAQGMPPPSAAAPSSPAPPTPPVQTSPPSAGSHSEYNFRMPAAPAAPTPAPRQTSQALLAQLNHQRTHEGLSPVVDMRSGTSARQGASHSSAGLSNLGATDPRSLSKDPARPPIGQGRALGRCMHGIPTTAPHLPTLPTP